LTAPDEIRSLVERFHDNQTDYLSPAYKEYRLRQEFLDPMFRILGWDMDNSAGYAEAYKDVVHEDSISVAGRTKAPDYAFRVGGVRKFFVEAKKPAVRLKNDQAAAYQLRRYAWSAKLPLSVLTDFDEFAVYDTRIRPEDGDVAGVARILYLTRDEYIARWGEIKSVFSREAVLKGSFDRYAASNATRRGTAEIDTVFLSDIERWRELLAVAISGQNKKLGLTRQDLNYCVQVTLDRIVFLRICEDRGLEPDDNLKHAAKGRGVYGSLLELFRAADLRYNSGLFHFDQERGRGGAPDTLTPSLRIDDAVLRKIITGLYYPSSPYEFSVISADILGKVYEQFLGKSIKLDGSGRVAIEEKPEVRKAGGVYYTPSFVVDYIVRTTLSEVLHDKTPDSASRIKIVDPSCGSGSFLVAVYQHLLDWHLDKYIARRGSRRPIHQVAGGAWRLTTAERKRILLNNVFGVDIDVQAVEVTKLSLLLKVIEGESQTELAVARLLPDLDSNIKCGNSLIDDSFYAQRELPKIADEEEVINAFNWRGEFPGVFAAGGFDAVLGNPPYLNIDDTWGTKDPRLAYIKRTYSNVYNDKTDILFYFLAKATEITKGEVAFIVSRAFLEAFKADRLRGWLSTVLSPREIIDFRNAYVFEGVGITTAIVRFTRTSSTDPVPFYRYRLNKLPPTMSSQDIGKANFETLEVPRSSFSTAPWLFAERTVDDLLKKIDAAGEPLGTVLHLGKGMETGRNQVFGRLAPGLAKTWGLPKESYYIRARNSDVQRFRIKDSGELLLYTEVFRSFDEMPKIVQEHLKTHRSELEERAAFKRGNCNWWQWTWPLHKKYVRNDKIVCPYLATENRFALDVEQKYLGLTDTTILYDAGQPENLRYFLGILNSDLLTFRFRYIGKLKSGGILEYFWNTVSKLSVKRLDVGDDRHERMVRLVQDRIDLVRLVNMARTAQEAARLQKRAETLDTLINQLTYELYEVSEDEVAVVESLLAEQAEHLAAEDA